MKLRSRILAFAILATASLLTSCSGPAGYTYKNVTLTLSFSPICSGTCINGNVFTEVPAGTNVGPVGAIELPLDSSGQCIELTAAVTNAPANLTWTIVPTPLPNSGTSNVGTLTYTTGTTNFYCEPSAIPIYSSAQLVQAQAAGLQQGETEVVVTVPADPNNPSNVVTAIQTFTAQVRSVPSAMVVGIVPANNIKIPLASVYQFSGYVLGNNGYTNVAGVATPVPAQSQIWYVNGVHGGSTTTGTITDAGLYTAPAAYPSTGKTVTITMASAAYPSIITGGTGQGNPTVITFQ